MAEGSLEASGTFVEVVIDTDVTELPVLEAGFMVVGVIVSKGCVIVATSPPDFSTSDCSVFFFGQG